MNIDEVINGWTFEKTIKTAKSLMEAETNMFKWDVIRHLRNFAEAYREQLKEYQQLEEQGRLIKLPCKVGDTVYHVVQGRIVEVSNVDLFFLLLSVVENRFNNSVFLTKSEAEAKLEELRGSNE